ncbi:MAG: phage late control D family protein [Deltaproteobacteria bacterium]|nr:phage late control D family protein [Deltaproteobacteria bacterium]MCW5809014.1 phage late control D family protein [Deltaproteobacteria bacterium]
MVAVPSSAGSGAASVEDSVELKLKVAGKELTGGEVAHLAEVRISQTLGMTGTLELRLAAWDADSQELSWVAPTGTPPQSWVDGDRFAPGAEVEVSLGYAGASKLVFSGNFTKFSIDASAAGRAYLRVWASDLLERLARDDRAEVYLDTTCAGVVRKIAERAKMKVDAADDDELDPECPSIEQPPMTDLRFIREKLAARLGYDLYADGATLVFKKSQLREHASLTLTATEHVISFNAELAETTQLGGVEVYAFDTLNKKFLVGKEKNSASADQAFSTTDSRAMIVDGAITKQEQVDAKAKIELAKMRGEYIAGSATCFGRTDLRPGIMIALEGFGKRFGGDAYVTSVTHTVTPSGGFRTAFTWKGQPR